MEYTIVPKWDKMHLTLNYSAELLSWWYTGHWKPVCLLSAETKWIVSYVPKATLEDQGASHLHSNMEHRQRNILNLLLENIANVLSVLQIWQRYIATVNLVMNTNPAKMANRGTIKLPPTKLPLSQLFLDINCMTVWTLYLWEALLIWRQWGWNREEQAGSLPGSQHGGPPLPLPPSPPALELAGSCCWEHVLGTPQRDCG